VDKNILDLGSGMARFQKAMDASEIRYKEFVNVDNMATGRNIINGDITTEEFIDKLPIKQYDTIIASHCLEHLPYPSKVLNIWQRLLSKEGIIYVEVPSYYDTDGWMKYEHISYFDEGSLEKLMERFFRKIEAGRLRKNIYYIGGEK
jgi:SAM-dependent methyltransferase